MADDKHKLILVDDDAIMREVLMQSLVNDPFSISPFAKGQDAIEHFQKHGADAILLDAVMPGMDGAEVCRALRSLPEGDVVPIIFVTGHSDRVTIEEAFASGATDIVFKPINRTVLRYRLRHLVRSRRQALTSRLRDMEFNTIVQTLPEALCITDVTQKILFCNQTVRNLFGFSPDELIGQPVYRLWASKSEFDALNRVGFRFYDNVPGGNATEVRMLRKGGETFDAETVVSPVQKHRDYVIGYLHLVRDITQRKRDEEERMKSDRLEMIGALAAGIAHDFNNYLAAILTNLEHALDELGEGSPAAAHLRECEPVISQAKLLSRQLLTFSKGGEPVRKLMQPQGLIRETSLFALRGSRCKPQIEIADDLWPARLDESQIAQVLTNILVNASQAMSGGGEVKLQVSNESVTKQSERGEIPPGLYVRIRISDTGVGIPKENLSKIFIPYFTTKTSGTGLGLATAYSIIKRHGGTIDVESKEGEGSTFTIYLPASPKESDADAGSRKTPSSPGAGKAPATAGGEAQASAAGAAAFRTPTDSEASIEGSHILLLEDQEIIALGIARLLRRAGASVDIAYTGEEAITLFESGDKASNPFDILILDLTIPGHLGGLEVVQRLKPHNPDLKSIAVTGYWDDPIMANPLKYGFCEVLGKPFKHQALLDAVDRVLSGQQDAVDE